MSMHRNIIPNYSQQYATFLALFLHTLYLKLYVQLYAPDDGRRNSLKHVERL